MTKKSKGELLFEKFLVLVSRKIKLLTLENKTITQTDLNCVEVKDFNSLSDNEIEQLVLYTLSLSEDDSLAILFWVLDIKYDADKPNVASVFLKREEFNKFRTPIFTNV